MTLLLADQRHIQQAEEAFLKIKNGPVNAALLAHPDANAETLLVTDALDSGIGATLEQLFDSNWKPLAFLMEALLSSSKELQCSPEREGYGSHHPQTLRVAPHAPRRN